MKRGMFVLACCAALAVVEKANGQGPRGGQGCGGMSSSGMGTSFSTSAVMPSTATNNYASQYQSSYYQSQQAYWRGLQEAAAESQARAAEAARMKRERWEKSREVVRQRRIEQESKRAARRRALAAVAQDVR